MFDASRCGVYWLADDYGSATAAFGRVRAIAIHGPGTAPADFHLIA